MFEIQLSYDDKIIIIDKNNGLRSERTKIELIKANTGQLSSKSPKKTFIRLEYTRDLDLGNITVRK